MDWGNAPEPFFDYVSKDLDELRAVSEGVDTTHEVDLMLYRNSAWNELQSEAGWLLLRARAPHPAWTADRAVRKVWSSKSLRQQPDLPRCRIDGLKR